MELKCWLPWVITLNIMYLVWVYPFLSGWYGYVFYAAELGLFSLTLLFAVCHWHREEVSLPLPTEQASHAPVDVFVTCYDEPKSMIEKTLKAAVMMKYGSKTVHVLDDGHRQDVKELAQKYGAKYLDRGNNAHAKAGNLNHGLKNSTSEYILVIDADQVADSDLLERTMPFITLDATIAFVTTRQRFDVHTRDFNHDHMFYGKMQAGKHADDCASSTGSGVIYRRSALDSINGFATWNLVEDFTTSYELHRKGYKSVYVCEAHTTGLAPQDLKNIYKQRGTWAIDSLRLLYRKNPLFDFKLNLKQRLHYFEMCYHYMVSGLFIPILFLFPAISLLTGNPPINANGIEYMLLRLPSFAATVFFYNEMSHGHESNRFWVGLWPVYMKAVFLAMSPRKQAYKVTQKVEKEGRRISLILPQLLLLLLGMAGTAYSAYTYGPSSILLINCLWLVMQAWWVEPIIIRAFQKKHPHVITLHEDIQGIHV